MKCVIECKMVTEEKINNDYSLSDFQKRELAKLFSKGTKVIDFYVDFDDNDLMVCYKNDDVVVESYIICENDDVFFSRVHKADKNLDMLVKIN